MKPIIYITILIFLVGLFGCITNHDIQLKKAIENNYRSKEEKKRDKYRNPYETLTFFGINKKNKTHYKSIKKNIL